jgi:four helix bundle protein
MGGIQTFHDLLVWQKAHANALLIYKLTEHNPNHELYALTSQARRAATLVPANIVEGFRKQTIKDSIKFYNQADASLEELKYHILLMKDLTYISEEQYNSALSSAEEVGKLLTRWIQSQRKFA